MDNCKSYRTREVRVPRFSEVSGQCFETKIETVGFCIGTAECDECECCGDTNRCDFYPENRKAGKEMATEDRLISANKLKAHYAWWGDTEERKVFDDIVDLQPTVGAVPVVHGRWVDGLDGTAMCSNCNETTSFHELYCPNCGSMNGGGKNDKLPNLES